MDFSLALPGKSLLSSAERDEGTVLFGLESLKACFGQVSLQIRNVKDMHVFAPLH
jgi:hypothetical protein